MYLNCLDSPKSKNVCLTDNSDNVYHTLILYMYFTTYRIVYFCRFTNPMSNLITMKHFHLILMMLEIFMYKHI